MRFVSLLPGGFITDMVVNPPKRKQAKRTSVQCALRDCSAGTLQVKVLEVGCCDLA